MLNFCYFLSTAEKKVPCDLGCALCIMVGSVPGCAIAATAVAGRDILDSVLKLKK